MEYYIKYKKAYPNKTDAQIIELLAWELKNKVETIGHLLNKLHNYNPKIPKNETFSIIITQLNQTK